MRIETEILMRGQDVIPYSEFSEMAELVERRFSFSSHKMWMWKMLQIGYILGKRTERARRKKNI